MVGPMNAIFKKLITYGYPKLCDVFLYNSKWKIIRNKATKCDRLFIALAHSHTQSDEIQWMQANYIYPFAVVVVVCWFFWMNVV